LLIARSVGRSVTAGHVQIKEMQPASPESTMFRVLSQCSVVSAVRPILSHASFGAGHGSFSALTHNLDGVN